jgi:hypothetical protein
MTGGPSMWYYEALDDIRRTTIGLTIVIIVLIFIVLIIERERREHLCQSCASGPEIEGERIIIMCTEE